MSDVKKTREQIDAEINEVILVQGNSQHQLWQSCSKMCLIMLMTSILMMSRSRPLGVRALWVLATFQ